MSNSLGEKLRQAREERGISISEVAEQTRISPHYLASIENDDYRTLPGGIFNKGFVKSYAKYVGVDEQEALQDYARLISSQQSSDEAEDSKTYRPEVLTDDRTSGSNLPTIIIAIIILALMTGGVLMLVNYLQNQPTTDTAKTPSAANTNQANASANATVAPTPVATPGEIKVEFKLLKADGRPDESVALSVTVDGKLASESVAVDTAKTYIGQNSVRLRYYRGFAERVQITVNGKQITSPAPPAKGNGVEFEINKQNVVGVIEKGAIPDAAGGSATANANTTPVANSPR